MPLAIPDLRREPFVHTDFWKVVGFPEDEPTEISRYAYQAAE